MCEWPCLNRTISEFYSKVKNVSMALGLVRSQWIQSWWSNSRCLIFLFLCKRTYFISIHFMSFKRKGMLRVFLRRATVIKTPIQPLNWIVWRWRHTLFCEIVVLPFTLRFFFVRRSVLLQCYRRISHHIAFCGNKHVELGNGLGANVQTNLFLAKSHSTLYLLFSLSLSDEPWPSSLPSVPCFLSLLLV